MQIDEQAQTSNPGPKFDTLFSDPRHFRGDCRMLRTAIRRGWLDDVPQADRDALLARFDQAGAERHAADPDRQNFRAFLAEAWARIELAVTDHRDLMREMQYAWAGELADRDTSKGGRPRSRWYVTDFAQRLDANELRRRAKAEGREVWTLQSINVRSDPPPGEPDGQPLWCQRVALWITPDARYGWRLWLVCPQCKSRRTHLYPVRAGVRCRECARLAYADGGR